jgi:amino acid adenylation domain-containing protein
MNTERYSLLARLLQQQGIENTQEEPILPGGAEIPLALSWGQERLWFFDQLIPHSALYNIPLSISIKGPLQVPLVERCLTEIVRRHAVLRTTFVILGGQPHQQIAPTFQVPLQYIDLRGLSPAAQARTIQTLSESESRLPFALDQGPLLRVALLVLAADRYLLLLTVHHIVFDGWSLEVFLREFALLYRAYLQGEAAPLADLPIQYTDYVRWQRQHLQGPLLEKHLTVWQRRLAGVPIILDLPTDYPYPKIQTFRGDRYLFTIPATLLKRLKSFGQQENCSLFMTLLAAFEVLLYRYSGQEDFVVGTPITERSRQETTELIGFFVNTLPLRANLVGQPTYRNLLKRVREVALEAYAHQVVPFESLVELLQPVRDPSHAPVVQVMFSLQQDASRGIDLPGLTLTLHERGTGTAKFDLLLELLETPEGLTGQLEYRTDLFAATTIARMAEHFQILLESLLTAPDQRIGELPLLTAAEQHQLLVEWNATEKMYSTDRCLHHLFEEQAIRTPEAIALMFCDEQLTYRDVNWKADQLAQTLRQRGVGPEVAVGLYLERSLEMIVCLLGILKAGGAYVPLDPAYPQERLAFLLQDAQIRVLITQQSLRPKLPALPGVELYLLETGWATLSLERHYQDEHALVVTPANLAYIIYTSGSTGQPKGVQVEHQNAVALLCWARDFFTPQALAGVLAASSICFDVSVFEIFAPLICGGTAIVARNILELPMLAPSRPITLINIVPSVANELATYGPFPASIKTVNFAGEALPGSVVQKIAYQGNIERIYNLYGPSETTIYSTVALVNKEESNPCIGRPLANTQAYVLDGNLQPVPVGVAGDLYIGGAGLARGYCQRAELTAERFIPHPFPSQPSTRLYKTGDRVRYLPDGQLQFLGRSDHQVKMRGFRIELDEIQVTLSQHPAVREKYSASPRRQAR